MRDRLLGDLLFEHQAGTTAVHVVPFTKELLRFSPRWFKIEDILERGKHAVDEPIEGLSLKKFSCFCNPYCFRPASPPTRVHHFEPLNLATAPITVH